MREDNKPSTLVDLEIEEDKDLDYEFKVEESDVGKRLDSYLAEKISDLTRSYIKKLFDEDRIRVNGKLVKASFKVNLDDEVEISVPEAEELDIEAQNIDLNIIYEDDNLAVIYKPQGMVVHPAPGNMKGTLVNGLLYHLKNLSGVNGVKRPGIVHRIDKDTSGILVVAKDDKTHKGLSEQLKNHSMKRTYYALVTGGFKNLEGTIEGNLARDPKNRLKYAVRNEGKRAVTHYKVLCRYKDTSLLEVNLETGRTHQIRVHMSYIGHPLVGDPIYGSQSKKIRTGNNKGQLLHAGRLGFIHPITSKYMEFHVPVPLEYKEVLKTNLKEVKGRK